MKSNDPYLEGFAAAYAKTPRDDNPYRATHPPGSWAEIGKISSALLWNSGYNQGLRDQRNRQKKRGRPIK